MASRACREGDRPTARWKRFIPGPSPTPTQTKKRLGVGHRSPLHPRAGSLTARSQPRPHGLATLRRCPTERSCRRGAPRAHPSRFGAGPAAATRCTPALRKRLVGVGLVDASGPPVTPNARSGDSGPPAVSPPTTVLSRHGDAALGAPQHRVRVHLSLSRHQAVLTTFAPAASVTRRRREAGWWPRPACVRRPQATFALVSDEDMGSADLSQFGAVVEHPG